MINKLDSVERRYDEIEKLLSDPDVLSDHMRVQSLAKEQATMKNLVLICRRYRHTKNELVDVSEILRNESDQEMITFARQELSRLEKEKIQLEDDLKIALLPRASASVTSWTSKLTNAFSKPFCCHAFKASRPTKSPLLAYTNRPKPDS